MKLVFFGTPDIAVSVLEELAKKQLLPSLVVTAPDALAGRGMHLQSPAVKQWAQKHTIPLLQPTHFDADLYQVLQQQTWDVFVVAAYGKILPQKLLDIPTHGVLNMHPSLLPLHRGPSPIEAQILNDDELVGVTIMLLDEQMDHGPIVAQEVVDIEPWPTKASTLKETLGREGGKLLADVLPEWVAGTIDAQEQDHTAATYCSLITKENAKIDLGGEPYKNYLKFLAYEEWPRVFYFTKDNKRVIITDAEYRDGSFIIKKVIPEGKKEMPFSEFQSAQ